MTHESSPEDRQEPDYDREIAYANKMRAEAEERFAETFGIDVDKLREVDPRLILSRAEWIVKWAAQASHYATEKRRQSGDPDWYLKK